MLVLVQFLFKVISKSQIGDLWYEITSSTNKHTSLVLLIDILRGMLINVLRYLKEPLPKSSVIIKNCIIVGDLNVDLMKDETHYNTGNGKTEQFKGIVCVINEEVGFGYIAGELPSYYTGQNVFFLLENVQHDNKIKKGDAVEFLLDGKSRHDLNAQWVWLLNETQTINRNCNGVIASQEEPTGASSFYRETFPPKSTTHPFTSSSGESTSLFHQEESQFVGSSSIYNGQRGAHEQEKPLASSKLFTERYVFGDRKLTSGSIGNDPFSLEGSAFVERLSSSENLDSEQLSFSDKAKEANTITEPEFNSDTGTLSCQSKPTNEAAFTGTRVQTQLCGKVCSLKEVYGKIRPIEKLPEDYSQSKNVHFYLSKVLCGFMPLRNGDEVEFTLGTKDKDKPLAIKVRVIRFCHRDLNEIRAYLKNIFRQFEQFKLSKESMSSDGNMPTNSILKSEFLVSLLTCLPAWHCVCSCQNLNYEDFSLLLKLMLEIEDHCPLEEIFCKVVKVISNSKLFNVFRGGLKKFIACSIDKNDENEIVMIQAFLLMVVRHNPEKIRAVAKLSKPMASKSNCYTCKFMHNLLKETGKMAIADITDMAWEELPLVPATEELLFGPLEGEDLEPIKKTGPYMSTEEYMDTYFRLLRADCFYPLKKGIRELMNGKLDSRDMYVYKHISLQGIHVSQTGVTLCLKILPQSKVLDWDRCSNLMFGNLLCISISGNFKDAIWATVTSRELLRSHDAVIVDLCTESNNVSDSEAIMILENADTSSLMVESPTYYRAYQPVLKTLQKLNPDNFYFKEELVDIKSQDRSIFTGDEASFDAQVLYPGRNQMIPINSFLQDSELQNTSSLDPSQEAALRDALLHRLAIVQGPPGTGKTHLGIKMVQILLSISPIPALPILVVTYKNHALDEFLKALIELYPDEVVRIGGRSQDPKVEKCNLNELKKAKKISEAIFKEIQRLKDEAEQLKKEVDNAYKILSQANKFTVDYFLNSVTVGQVMQLLINCSWSKTKVKSFSGKAKKDENEFTEVKKKRYKDVIKKAEVEEMVTEVKQWCVDDNILAGNLNWTADLMELIKAAVYQWVPDNNAFVKMGQKFSLPAGSVIPVGSLPTEVQKGSEAIHNHDTKDVEDEEKERLAAISAVHTGVTKERLLNEIVFAESIKQSPGSPKLLSCARNLVAQNVISNLINTENLWELNNEDRVTIIQFIMLRHFEDAGRHFEAMLKKFQDICHQKDELEDQHKADIVASKKVLGMTITGASINNKLLEKLRPAIVIMEEAAEVQEPQLLAALGDWARYLIMIGDQQQLRPKVENYALARNFHLDVSMMERLISNKLPYSTLQLQNRMMPEFADLLKDIYPNLKSNLQRVQNHVPANCIFYPSFFWSHSDQETKGRSYTNEGEADRAIKLALFLIQQGYEPQKITILAAYQGQTALLRRKRKKAESDYPRIFDQWKGRKGSKTADLENTIQIHTIDMYQGDENDFVIISLVRSNQQKITGFLNSLNRRCVAQSRSRCGLYFIGNANVLSSSVYWSILIRKLQEKHRVGPSIPINCPNHREVTVIPIKHGKDIRIGQQFCKESCIFQMTCGSHKCRQACQPPHSHDKCKASVTFTFLKCGHEGRKECHEDAMKLNCSKVVPVTFASCHHQGQVMCFLKGAATCEERCTKQLQCEHPCHLKCGEVCRPEECKYCAKIREQEALARRRVEEEAIKAAKREAEKQIEEIKKRGTPQIFRQELFPKGDTASEYYDTADRVKKYIQPGHNWFPLIKKIEKVTNSDLEVKWLKTKRTLFDPRRSELKFHGTSAEGVEGITSSGFRMPKPGNHMYGAGIYFASDSSKSAQEMYTKGSGMLLLCDVLLGKSLTVESACKNMDASKLKSKGYDSLYAKRDTRSTQGVLYDEFVVYNPHQAIPRYIIHFQKQKYQNISNVDVLQTDAVAANKIVKHVLKPKREVDFTNPLDVHYRIAESQFLRLIQRGGLQMNINSIDYWINPKLVLNFQKKEADMLAKYPNTKESKAILAFHGTKQGNVEKIMRENFRLDKLASNTGNKGFYGAGIYFSEFPSTSIGYSSGSGSLILCKVLAGRSYDCTGMMMGASLRPGFDSHRQGRDAEGRGHELVIFDPNQILPCYVINCS